ncbi:hypothetical protein [Streptomyces sp. ISL-94]|uniref:hypothetical protein n=1 Tax=Streptomyces sp. ISL-94 TaxID=2819190 RepID=UPI001BE75A7A|nr:hypothetical protein [Streptomyces sp. ISL-94]MBT2481055.1 hypothetical protein [Streptomyces sp. ISL-94]
MTATVPTLPSEPALRVNFLDHLIPRATPGTYRVQVHNTLTDTDGELDAGDRLPTTEETFEIRAARFVLAQATVHALYPPPASRSSYGRTLPHITFNRPTLPWERNQAGTRSGPEARPPWLALLVFGAGELPDDPGATGATVLRTVDELRHPAESGVVGPVLPEGSVSDSEAAGKCATIDVPAELFTAVAPHDDEMYYLAHVRKVAAAGAARADGEVLAPASTGSSPPTGSPAHPGSTSSTSSPSKASRAGCRAPCRPAPPRSGWPPCTTGPSPAATAPPPTPVPCSRTSSGRTTRTIRTRSAWP